MNKLVESAHTFNLSAFQNIPSKMTLILPIVYTRQNPRRSERLSKITSQNIDRSCCLSKMTHNSPIVYTRLNPRRSERLSKIPEVVYFTKKDLEEEEYDDIAKAIKIVCNKMYLVYNDELVIDFYNWLLTDSKYIIINNIEISKIWAKSYSVALIKQKNQIRLDIAIETAIIKQCKKNNIIYTPQMAHQFTLWNNTSTNCDNSVSDQDAKFAIYPFSTAGTSTRVRKWFLRLFPLNTL